MREWHYFLDKLDEIQPDIQKQVYQSFYKFVYKDIYYLLKDHALTEDMIQEVLFKVLLIIHKHQIDNLTAWIRQVARNHTLDYLRKNSKERHIRQLSDISIIEYCYNDSDTLQVDDEVEMSITDEVLHQSILELKSDYRILITLHYIEEISYQELTVILGLSQPAVGQKLMRARRKLLQIFKGKWGNQSA